jgi:hypothetical protein
LRDGDGADGETEETFCNFFGLGKLIPFLSWKEWYSAITMLPNHKRRAASN